MGKRQLLIDSFDFKLNHLQEQGTNGYEFAGKFAQADVPTSNKRIYPRGLWERELNKLSRKIAEGKVYGELDHPDDGKTKLQRSACLITGLKIDENGQIIGKLKVLETSMGKELRAIVDGGGAIGISSRGYGSVRMNEDGYNVVQDDFNLMTFDPVADPAEESAYLETEMPMKQANESQAQDNVSPEKNEVTKDDENLDAKENSTDDVTDAPKGNVSTNEQGEPKTNDDDDEGEEQEEQEEPDQDDLGKEKPLKKEGSSVPSNIGSSVPKNVSSSVPQTPKPQKPPKAESKEVKDAISKLKKTFESQLVVAVKEAKEKVRSEIMSEMMTDPSIAGAKEALDKLKSVLRPYVLPEDANKVVESKDSEIAALEAKIKELQVNLKNVNLKLTNMTEAAKEMGFNLYLERNLSGLSKSKFKKIVESVGDYSKIASLEELKRRVAPSVREAREIGEAKDRKIQVLTERLEERTEQVEALREELEEALETGLENAARVYLERKITGNPYQSELRKRFEGLDRKTKSSVDKLVAESQAFRMNENSDFTRVRSRLQKRHGFKPSDNLVEEKVRETFPKQGSEENFEVLEGHSFKMSEIEKLAGVR